jgi:hypothetical protein
MKQNNIKYKWSDLELSLVRAWSMEMQALCYEHQIKNLLNFIPH